ncbi:MAG: ABC transporter substrate-binding protein [Planctomycetia bacterium]
MQTIPRSRRRFLASAATYACAAPGCATNKPTSSLRPIRMIGMPTGFYLPLFFAIDKGLFEVEGLSPELTLLNNASHTMNGLLKGEYEFGAFGSGNVFAIESKQPGTLSMVYAQHNRSYSVVKRKGLSATTIDELKGLKIGTWPSPTSTLCLKSLLNPRIGKNSFTIVPVEHQHMAVALEQGSVDAVFSTDIYTSQILQKELGEVLAATPMPTYVKDPFFNGGGAILRSNVKKNPDIAKSLQRVFSKALHLIREENNRARLSLAAHLKVDPSITNSVLLDDFVAVEDIDLSSAQFVADAFLDAGAIDKRIDMASFLSREGLT